MSLDFQNLPEGFTQVLVAVLIATLLIWALYANTIRKTLKLIAPENRFLAPNMAWLLVIPVYNIYWNFVMAARLSDSLTNEFFDRKIAEEESPGRHMGIRYAILYLLSNIPFPAFIGLTFFLVGVVYFITYWVKIYNFMLLLEEHNKFLINNRD